MINQTTSFAHFVSKDIKLQRYWDWAGNESPCLSLTLSVLDSKVYGLIRRTVMQAILSHATGAWDSMNPQDHPSSDLPESLEPFMATPIYPVPENKSRTLEIGLMTILFF